MNAEIKTLQVLPVNTMLILVLLLSSIATLTTGFMDSKHVQGDLKWQSKSSDSSESVKAFMKVYMVLMSPRCMNCHPSGDVPLQGDNSLLHQMAPKRGKDGKGIYAMKCSSCHQPENTPGIHTPPGNPKWALPPADMKMVFEGKKPRELALQIMNYEQNGHKNKEQLLEHARDTLVKAGWNMGEGRIQPPLTYDAFVTEWDTWITKGGFAPAQ
ncbi:MAG: hypothetical protein WKI04_14970 [Ferruginibacter sp.]